MEKLVGLNQELIIETKAAYVSKRLDKSLITYDQSLARIKSIRPQARHLRPKEAFSLLIGNLEGRLSDKHKEVANDMVTSYGEWLSLSLERRGNELIARTDPEGIVYDLDGRGYLTTHNFQCSEEKTYDISDVNVNDWISIEELPLEFVTDFYGRPANELPEPIRNKSRIFLPQNERSQMLVGRIDLFSNGYDITGHASRASRGAFMPNKIEDWLEVW